MLYQTKADSQNGNVVGLYGVWVDVVLWVDWLSMFDSRTCTVIWNDVIPLYGSCLLWNVWLSGLGDLGWYCTVCYIWVGCGTIAMIFLCLPVWKLCRTLFSDICCWSCMVLWLCGLSGLCALLLIYPSILVWYRWGGGTFNLCAVSVLS